MNLTDFLSWLDEKKLSDPKHKWLLDSHVKIILVYKFIVTIEQHSILFQADFNIIIIIVVGKEKHIHLFFT